MITKDTYRNQYNGLSTDSWSSLKDLSNGDVKFEMDTGKASMWDEENKRWSQISQSR